MIVGVSSEKAFEEALVNQELLSVEEVKRALRVGSAHKSKDHSGEQIASAAMMASDRVAEGVYSALERERPKRKTKSAPAASSPSEG